MRRNLAVVALAAPADRAGDRASGAFQRPAGDKPPAPVSCAHLNLEISAPLLPAVRAGRLHHKPFAVDPCVEDLPARPAAPLDIALGRCRHRLRYSRPPAGRGGGKRGQVAVRQDRDDNRGGQQVGNAGPKRGKSTHRKQGEMSATKRRQKRRNPHKPQKEKKARKGRSRQAPRAGAKHVRVGIDRIGAA